MNTRELQRQIADTKSTITDEELFSSKAYQNYLQNIIDNISEQYGRGAIIQTKYDTDDNRVAYTDNFRVFVNTANEITLKCTTKTQKNLSCIGLIGHESGHILFTDFQFADKYSKAVRKGKFFPVKPKKKDFNVKYVKNIDELTDVFSEANNAKLRVIEQVAMQFSNIVEDGYVERCMKTKFPGTVAMGIGINNIIQADLTPSLQDMVDKDYKPIAIFSNLLLQYVKTGRVENQELVKNEYTDTLFDCLADVDMALCENNSKIRMAIINKLLIYSWSFIKPLLDDIENNSNSGSDESDEEKSENSEENNSNPTNSDGVTGQEEKADEIISNLQNQMVSSSEESENMNTNSIDESVDINPERLKYEQTEIEDMIADGNGTITIDNSFIAKCSENDIEKILNNATSEIVAKKAEEKLLTQLNADANSISYGNIHKGVDITIHRQQYLNGDEIKRYNDIMRELRPVSSMLAKSVQNVLKQRKRNATEKGLYMGSRLDSSSYYRADGRVFTKRNLPSDNIDMSVAILVDESGSMCGDRIANAQAMALIVYDFCSQLNIPVTIYGHNYGYDGVDLYSFAEFDSIDGNDKYRLMNMNAYNCNRDGCAVRYVAEKLCKRFETMRMFIVVSDGQPSADSYCGTAAEQDLQSIRKEYERKGITFYAAAIGDDKECIRRCYGEKAFLDLTDLKKFPMTIAKLIARNAI